MFQVMYLIVLSANYSQIKITKEVTEYKQAIALDDISRTSYWRPPQPRQAIYIFHFSVVDVCASLGHA